MDRVPDLQGMLLQFVRQAADQFRNMHSSYLLAESDGGADEDCADHYHEQDRIARHQEFVPALQIYLCQCKACHQVYAGGRKQVGKAVTELKGENGHLAGNANDVCQGSHDRHHNCRLAGAGVNENVDEGVGDEHADGCQGAAQVAERDGNIVYDGVQDAGIVEDHAHHACQHHKYHNAAHILCSAYKTLHGLVNVIVGKEAFCKCNWKHNGAKLRHSKPESGSTGCEENKGAKEDDQNGDLAAGHGAVFLSSGDHGRISVGAVISKVFGINRGVLLAAFYPEDQVGRNDGQVDDRNNGPESGAGVGSKARDLLSKNTRKGIDGGGHKAGEGAKDYQADSKEPVCLQLFCDGQTQRNEKYHCGDHGADAAQQGSGKNVDGDDHQRLILQTMDDVPQGAVQHSRGIYDSHHAAHDDQSDKQLSKGIVGQIADPKDYLNRVEINLFRYLVGAWDRHFAIAFIGTGRNEEGHDVDNPDDNEDDLPHAHGLLLFFSSVFHRNSPFVFGF